MKNTLVVNLYAGPGAGKSTAAAYIFAMLKTKGINVEYVTEYAKDKAWEACKAAFNCQLYINAKQAFRMSRVNGQVDVIVTDSPLLLGAIYADERHVVDASVGEDKKYKNRLDFFIDRGDRPYQEIGRNQTKEEALELDEAIKFVLKKENVEYQSVPSNEMGYRIILDEIYNKLGIEK